ncbi:MAG: hypothetical protein WDZ82_01205 [Candidatus Paceibacterota bacterium]
MLRHLIQPGEWILIASGLLMLVSVGLIYFGLNFTAWLAAKALYGVGVVLIVIKLFYDKK